MSRNIVRLVAIDGVLYFPKGGRAETEPWDECEDKPSLLVRTYDAGDCDTCPWPMVSQFSTREQLVERLQIALYDETQTNAFFHEDIDGIELPDGTPFDF